MSFAQSILARARPDSVRSLVLPRRTSLFPSSADWRDEVIYFLLPDRFSDGGESDRPLINPKDRGVNRPAGFRCTTGPLRHLMLCTLVADLA